MTVGRDDMGSSDDPTTTDPPAARITAGRKEWIGLAVIALPCLLYAMDLTVLYLAVPSISRDLAPSSAQLLWITDVYGFLLAGFLIPMGTLGDRIGRRRLLLIGAGAFGAVSLAAALSVSAPMLIASRALLGVAGATLAPSTLSLIRNMFLDSRERTIAIGVWIASISAGGAIGPLVGGGTAESLLVGLGLPDRPAGDGAAARPRADTAARVSRPRGGPLGSGERGHVPDGGPHGHLRAQADRPRMAWAGRRWSGC